MFPLLFKLFPLLPESWRTPSLSGERGFVPHMQHVTKVDEFVPHTRVCGTTQHVTLRIVGQPEWGRAESFRPSTRRVHQHVSGQTGHPLSASGDTTPCRMTGVTLHSHARYKEYRPDVLPPDPLAPRREGRPFHFRAHHHHCHFLFDFSFYSMPLNPGPKRRRLNHCHFSFCVVCVVLCILVYLVIYDSG